MEANPDGLRTLQALLRAELSAAHTYQLFLERARGPGADAVRLIRADHEEAARLLKEEILKRGGTVHGDGETWKNLEAIIEGSGASLQDPMALKALREGEEQDALSYENALDVGALSRDESEIVRKTLLPRTQAHLPMLERLLEAA